MSRVGLSKINVPSGVSVSLDGPNVKIKGAKGEYVKKLPDGISINLDGDLLSVTVKDKNDRSSRMLWGTYARLVMNAIKGVSAGFSKKLNIFGVGYRVALKNRVLEFSLGYSHKSEYALPKGVDVVCEGNTSMTISSYDREMLGNAIADIQAIREIDRYKAKGIRQEGQYVFIKEGKKK